MAVQVLSKQLQAAQGGGGEGRWGGVGQGKASIASGLCVAVQVFSKQLGQYTGGGMGWVGVGPGEGPLLFSSLL